MEETTMQEAPVAKYDPNKKYSWTPNDQFVLNGGEFGLLLNAFRSVLNSQEAARILLANEANNVIEAKLAQAVEAGVVKEAPEEQA